MKPLGRADILGAAEYARQRADLRRQVMALKDKRRVLVGDHCSVHFENRETLRYQVHEMLRAEGSWTRPGALDDEFSAYNPLLPKTGELSATVMFEYETTTERAVHLQRLVGIDRHIWLVVGSEKPLLAEFDRFQLDEGKISSVQFVKWRLDEVRRRLLKEDGTEVRIVVDHSHYEAEAVFSEQTRREIMNDPD
jgi:hypothetical protein